MIIEYQTVELYSLLSSWYTPRNLRSVVYSEPTIKTCLSGVELGQTRLLCQLPYLCCAKIINIPRLTNMAWMPKPYSYEIIDVIKCGKPGEQGFSPELVPGAIIQYLNPQHPVITLEEFKRIKQRLANYLTYKPPHTLYSFVDSLWYDEDLDEYYCQPHPFISFHALEQETERFIVGLTRIETVRGTFPE